MDIYRNPLKERQRELFLAESGSARGRYPGEKKTEMKYALVQFMVTEDGIRKPDFYYGGRNKKYHDMIDIATQDTAEIFDTPEEAFETAQALNRHGWKFEPRNIVITEKGKRR